MRISTMTGAMFALLLTAGCGSAGLGDILGGGGSPTGSSATDQIEGTVDQVDTGSRSIVLTNVRNYNSQLQSGGYGSGTTVRVYYDDRTTVEYQGQAYRPADLERGDRVAVRVVQSGDRLFAEAMQVTYNSAAGGGGSGGAYGGTIRGSVEYIDTGRRTIEIDRDSGSNLTVQYDNNTWVEYNGRRYGPQDLERGDQVELTVQQTSANVYVAQGITVLRSVGSGTGSGGSYDDNDGSVLRGTVRLLDTARRLITLEQTTWVSRFNPGTSANTVTVQYDNSTILEYQGRTAPVTGLERGDVIDVRVRDLGGSNLLAERITVVRDINSY